MATTQATNKETLVRSLSLSFLWFQRMVVPSTNKLCSEFNPMKGEHRIEPLGLVSELKNLLFVMQLSRFFKRTDFTEITQCSLNSYLQTALLGKTVEGNDGNKNVLFYLDSKVLGEPASIAHNSYLLSCLLEFEPRSDIAYITDTDKALLISGLANAVLSQQRENGSFKCYFDSVSDDGDEDMFQGEAMLALMKAHQCFGDNKYLESVLRGLSFCEKIYSKNVRLNDDKWIFFANFQAQVCRLLSNHFCKFLTLETVDLLNSVQHYLLFLYQDLASYFSGVRANPQRYSTIQVACAMEGASEALQALLSHEKMLSTLLEDQEESVGETLRLSLASIRRKKQELTDSIVMGVSFLLGMQEYIRTEGYSIGYGGYCNGIRRHLHLQRTDVTGNVCSALMKIYQLVDRLAQSGEYFVQFAGMNVSEQCTPWIQKR